MCGFAGVVAFEERYRAGREVLEAMAGCVAHRGPDGRGYHVDERAALAHVRLAILDPDPRSDQPFRLGGKWLVFNGEIYNFRELRETLSRERPEYQWRTSGDTEVLLVAYDTWGEKCLEKLNGMFAFVVWDEEKGEVFLARDRMGQKPLYYAAAPGGGGVAFASELGAIRAVPWFEAGMDGVGLTHFLSWGYVPAPWTIYRNAQKVMMGRWVRFRMGGTLEEGGYFDVNDGRSDKGVPLSEADRNVCPTKDKVRGVVEEGVKRQLVSDVPLGCFLSGGVDSSIVALCMKRAVGAGQRVMTFSIGFEDARYDETGYAREVARHLGTEHHEFRVRADAAGDLPKLARVYGEPFGDSSALPTHYLARETRQFVKVALSGDGGDELFGGYERYRAMRLAERLRFVPFMAGGIVLEQLPASHPKSAAARIRRFVRSAYHPAARRYAEFVGLMDRGLVGSLLKDADQAALGLIEREFERLRAGRDVVETALAVDRVTYLPEDLFTKVDRASMLHALEVRSPFMDPEVLTLAAGLRTEQLLKGGGKRMLREAFARDLPAEVFRRRKMGFAVPVGDWFRGELRGMLRDTLFAAGSFARGQLNIGVVEKMVEEHERRAEDHSQRLYALLMLELWWREGGR